MQIKQKLFLFTIKKKPSLCELVSVTLCELVSVTLCELVSVTLQGYDKLGSGALTCVSWR
jgi:hypothetical protein